MQTLIVDANIPFCLLVLLDLVELPALAVDSSSIQYSYRSIQPHQSFRSSVAPHLPRSHCKHSPPEPIQ